ncbi:MAG: S-layer homology domain-containing protein [Chloroflexota bacterium]
MRYSNRHLRLLTVVITVAALLLAAAPAGAYAHAEPEFMAMTIAPGTALPDTPVSVFVIAADEASGIRDGNVRLESPSGNQSIEVHLHWDYAEKWLVGTFVPNHHSESGEWRVAALRIFNNDRQWIDVPRNRLGAGFTLTGTTDPDLTPPAISDLRVNPALVRAGQPFTVEATLTDAKSGVAGGFVEVRFTGADGNPVHPEATLVPVGGNVWRAEFIASVDPGPYWRIELNFLRVFDAAGNRLELGQANLNKTINVMPASLPEVSGLDDDQVDLFYGRPLPFAEWAERDLKRLSELYSLVYRDRALAATVLVDEIADLSDALARVEGDLFMPAKPDGLRLASPAVTGRFLAVSGALRARLALYSILTYPSALTFSDVTRWASLVYPLEADMGPLPVDREKYRQYGLALTDLVARGLAESMVPSELYSAQHLVRGAWNDDLLPDNVVWLTPYSFADDIVAYHRNAEGDIYIGFDDYALANPLDTIDTAVHELGHHIHSVLLGERGTAGWSRYLTLRGVPEDGDVGAGHDGQREEAFAVDTVQAFAPDAVVNSTEYSSAFPGPQEVPDLRSRLRDFIAGELALGTPEPFMLTNPGREVAITASPVFTLTGRASPGATVTIWLSRDLNGLLAYDYSGEAWDIVADATGRFATPIQLDGPGLYTVQAEIERGGSVYVETAFIVMSERRPLTASWSVPGETPLSEVRISGTAPAGATVAINGRGAVADASGTFTVSVPLAPGANSLQLTVTSSDGRARSLASDIDCNPWSALAVDTLPAAVRTATVQVSGTGNPGEAVVIRGGAALVSTRVGNDRRFSISVPLNPGINKLEFHSTGPGVVRATVSYDDRLLLVPQVPEWTDRPRLIITGQAEPGATVTVNGKPTPVDAGGGFAAVIRPTAAGTRVSVSCIDAAGNTFSAERVVVLSGTPPALPVLKDIAKHWSRSEVEGLMALGVVSGMPGGGYEPERAVTRAEFVKMLALATGLGTDAVAYPAVATGATGIGAQRAPFIDTAMHWAAGYIQAAVKAGFLVQTDYAEGRFDPDARISRREIAVMAVRALGLSARAQASGGAAEFVDAREIGPQWAGYAVVAQAEGIIQGLPGGVFAPDQPTTRAQAATVISRVLAKLER